MTGLGYIGAALVRRLAHARGERVVALDNFYSTPAEAVAQALPSSVELLRGDVADPAAVARLFSAADGRPTLLVHLAAQPSAAMAAREPAVTERSNLVGARVVLEAAVEHGTPVVFGGSFRVYGDDLAGRTVDEQTPYGRTGDLSHLSKVYVEQLARMLRLRGASVRLGITYGLSPIMKTTPAFMTVPNLFCQRAAQGQALRVLEDRPMAFIHVEDAAAALLAAADRLVSGAPDAETFEPLNAAPEVATIGELARTVQCLAHARGLTVPIEGAADASTATPAAAGFVVRSRLAEAGFVAGRRLADGLGEVLDFFLRQAAGGQAA